MDRRNYIVISADGHCGADVHGYRPYLDPRFHDAFDAWAATYVDPWGPLDTELDDFRVGVSSFASPVNWDSAARQEYLERDGIVAEVLFPNTAPPFFPSASIGAHPRGDRREDEYRHAGLRAHNRWLVDFCQALPGRRAGIAQISLHDVDAALEDVRWAKEHDLRGVLLPSDSMLGLSNLYYPRFEPLWALCAELRMPLHRHPIVASEAPSHETGDAGALIGMAESHFLAARPLVHLILSGVFDRHLDLEFVFTEHRTQRVAPAIRQLDLLVDACRTDDSLLGIFGADAALRLQRKPSEYLDRVSYGTFLDASDIEGRYDIGVDRIMWGADFPHHEGTSPYSRAALQANFSGVPEPEVRRMTSQNAIHLYGFDAAALQRVADQIGPTVDELMAPPRLEDVDVHHMRYCPTFSDLVGREARPPMGTVQLPDGAR